MARGFCELIFEDFPRWPSNTGTPSNGRGRCFELLHQFIFLGSERAQARDKFDFCGLPEVSDEDVRHEVDEWAYLNWHRVRHVDLVVQCRRGFWFGLNAARGLKNELISDNSLWRSMRSLTPAGCTLEPFDLLSPAIKELNLDKRLPDVLGAPCAFWNLRDPASRNTFRASQFF